MTLLFLVIFGKSISHKVVKVTRPNRFCPHFHLKLGQISQTAFKMFAVIRVKSSFTKSLNNWWQVGSDHAFDILGRGFEGNSIFHKHKRALNPVIEGGHKTVH